MKILKCSILLLSMVTLIISCKKDKPLQSRQGEDLFLKVSKAEIKGASFQSFVDSFQIQTNGQWQIVGQNDWCKISSELGSGNATIVVNVSKNDSKDQRDVLLKVLAGQEEKDVQVVQQGFSINTSGPIQVNQEGGYLDLSAPSAYMIVNNNTNFDFSAGQSFSISFKVKSDGASASAYSRVICRRSSSSHIGYEVITKNNNGVIGVNVTDDAGGSGLGTSWGTTNIYDGKWHHVVAVFDAQNKTSYVYVDGHKERTEDYSSRTYHSITPDVPLLLGVKTTSGDDSFKGDLDEVRIWKKALTKEEVYADAADIKLTSDANDLIAGWYFEKLDGNGNVPDVSSAYSGELRDGAFLSNFTSAQNQRVVVYQSNTNGYGSFRIPAIIKAPNGDLLAFAEGRVNGSADFGNVDIVMKRSSDEGKTWSSLQVVANNGSLQADNSAPVVDMTDPNYPNGRIFLFYNTGNASESQIRNGNGERSIFYTTSTDNGATWSAPVDITSQVKKSDWRTYANTPGHAFQFDHGTYKGRIYVAANHSEGPPQSGFADYHAHGYYTDDHGKTFHISDNISFPGSNEATAAELSGDKMMMNMRNQAGSPRARIVAISNDGGQTWAKTFYDNNLPDPVCEGSILNIGYKNNNAILAFSNNASTTARENLTLRISFDEGKTWAKDYIGDYKGASTAYSDIVKMSDTEVGVLYERSGSSQIAFTAIKWE